MSDVAYLKRNLERNYGRWNHGLIFNGSPSKQDFGKMGDLEGNTHGRLLAEASKWGVDAFGPKLDRYGFAVDRWYYDGAVFYFRDLNDAIKFKLVWGQYVTSAYSRETVE